VKKHQLVVPVHGGQAAEPLDAPVSDQLAGGRRVILEQNAQKVAQLGGIPLLHGALLGAPEQFIGVADDPRPPKLAYAIDHLRGLAAGEGEVATMEHAICAPALDVRDHGLERRQVAVYV
jgi:hypothetical protein